MNIFKKSILLITAISLMYACTDLDLTNPNQETTGSFWKTEQDALNAVNATYNKLQSIGTYGRWLYFAYDNRSDLSLSNSPWTDLSNFSKFTFSSYDFVVNADIWRDHFQGIFRANQVINNVPNIEMDQSIKDRFIAEAKFIRGLHYFNLVNLYGNVPIITNVPGPDERPETQSESDVWEQVIQDFSDAKSALPDTYGAENQGRATKGAAAAMLGKSYMQLNRWDDAEQEFLDVINSPAGYDLLDDYGENFRSENPNSAESVFEIQFSDNSRLSAGIQGNNRPRFFGPPGPSFTDAEPTRFFFNKFFEEETVDGDTDPRVDYTFFYNREGGMDVYGTPYAERYGQDNDRVFWKKHTEYWQTGQDFDSELNYIVVRFSDVLLMYAEALNEQSRTAEAYGPINRVRERVNLQPLEDINPNFTQQEMREQIEHERILELGGESVRFLYLKRHDKLGTQLQDNDSEYQFFEPGRDNLLPVPQTEIDLNPNLEQNPNY